MDIKQLVYESTLFIHENYSEPISVTDISAQAYLSPSYFAMVFRVLTGFTVMNYLTRYRLHRAAEELVLTRSRIIDIAIESGFSSQQSFSKSFSQTYGIAPAQFRRLKPSFEPFPLKNLWEELPMELMDCFKNVKFIKKDAYYVVGFESEINYNVKSGTDPIGGVWDELNAEGVIDMIPDKTFDGTYGITHSETSGGIAKYIAGVEVNTLANLPTGVVGRKFEASEYAVFNTTLEIIFSGKFYKTLYAKWLPDSGYKYKEDPGVSTYEWAPFVKYPAIEVYPKGWEDTASPMCVYIPIVKKYS